MAAIFFLLVILFATPVVLFIVYYNRLVRLRTGSEAAWSQVDVELQRRADLVPNLAETVRGYAGHERGVFENVALARSRWQEAKTIPEKAQASEFLAGTLKSLFAVAENYPALLASQNFRELQQQLTEIETRIAAARKAYNEICFQYNTARQTFPSNLVAGMFTFAGLDYFQPEGPAARAVPKVEFGR